jgi:hypothetical protein
VLVVYTVKVIVPVPVGFTVPKIVAVSVVDPPRAIGVVTEVVILGEAGTTTSVSPASPQLVETVLPLAAVDGW